MKPKLTEAQALRWFEMLAVYDQHTPPDEWHWGEYDLAANAVLNASLFHLPRRFSAFGEKAQAPWNTAPPPSRTSWRSAGSRMPVGLGAPWVPRYFPDETSDIAVLQGKHTWVMRDSAAMLEHIKAAFGPSAKYITTADQANAELRGGAILFSFGRYVDFLDELHPKYPDFSRNPDVREVAFDSWQQECVGTRPDEVPTLMAWRDLLAVDPVWVEFVGLPFSR